MNGSSSVPKAPLDAVVPTLALTGLNFDKTATIFMEEGVPMELYVYLQGKCREHFDKSSTVWNLEVQRSVRTYLYVQMRDLVAQGRLRRSPADPAQWVFEEPKRSAP